MLRASLLTAAALAALAAGCASAPAPAPAPTLGTLAAGERVQSVLPLVTAAAARHAVPPALVLGVIQVESSFRPGARSHVGAAGLMQLMPRTAASLARRLGREDYVIDDPEFNIEAGTAYLAYLTRYFEGDLRLALAGYNAGPARVRRWQRSGRSLPRQVALYAANVLAARDRFARRLERGEGGEGGPLAPEPPGAARADEPPPDQVGLRDLIKRQEQLYGDRPDDPLPDDAEGTPPGGRAPAPATQPAGAPSGPEQGEPEQDELEQGGPELPARITP